MHYSCLPPLHTTCTPLPHHPNSHYLCKLKLYHHPNPTNVTQSSTPPSSPLCCVQCILSSIHTVCNLYLHLHLHLDFHLYNCTPHCCCMLLHVVACWWLIVVYSHCTPNPPPSSSKYYHPISACMEVGCGRWVGGWFGTPPHSRISYLHIGRSGRSLGIRFCIVASMLEVEWYVSGIICTFNCANV